MSILTLLLPQVLLSCAAPDAGPLRFGFPLPAKALARGLRVEGRARVRLQWRRLQNRPDPQTGRVWVELCLVGARTGARTGDQAAARAGGGRVRILAGGPARESVATLGRPSPLPAAWIARSEAAGRRGVRGGRSAVVCRHLIHTREEADVETELHGWAWGDGTVDVERRLRFLATQDFDQERYAAGEVLTVDAVPERFLRASITAASWRRAGVLPGHGRAARGFRARLLDAVPALREMRGARDRGDYRRSADVVTNLEFDMSLGLARLGLAAGRVDLLARAWRSAVHSVDRDLDPQTGLLFRHGRGHRTGPPDPGHTWLAGILLVGCLAADQRLLDSARRIARGLARHPAMGRGRDDRIRDVGWPLLGMETWLRFEDDPEVAAAASRIVSDLLRRFEPKPGLLRFGEGVGRRGVYEDPLWVVAGCLLPGLRAHQRRVPRRAVAKMIRALESRLRRLVCQGKPGLPVRTWSAGGLPISQARVREVPAVYLLLEGIDPRRLPQVLARRQVLAGLGEVPKRDDPDLATTFAMVARCAWVYR